MAKKETKQDRDDQIKKVVADIGSTLKNYGDDVEKSFKKKFSKDHSSSADPARYSNSNRSR